MEHDSSTLRQINQWATMGDRHATSLIGVGLTLAALVLMTINLGGLPLRDWDEGTVAQVAREIARSGSIDGWLYPTLHGAPYLNKPPLVHWLMAGLYHIGGVNEWTARLPGAVLTALSVPLVYGIGREIFVPRRTAFLAAGVYLTMLPVVRHGRLAMLDGAALSFFLLMMWSLLRSRRDPRWSLGVGVGFGLICFTKGALGLLLGAIAFCFMLWDAPRLLRSVYLWLGLLLGSAPAIAWYGAQWLHYGDQFLTTHVANQSLNRLWDSVEGNTGPPWFYLLELLKYGLPWLLLLPMGMRWAWGDRHRSWGRLVLVWSLGYLVVISLIRTKLPWYLLPIYPALALIAAFELNRLWQTLAGESAKLAPSGRYVGSLVSLLSLLAIAAWGGVVYFYQSGAEIDLAIAAAALGLTLTTAIAQLVQRHREFISVLMWGLYVTMLLVMVSDNWVWELAEDYPVRPVAQLIRQNTPADTVIYTDLPYGRPSLNFYSDRQVIAMPDNFKKLRQHWRQDPAPYLLLDERTFQRMDLRQAVVLGEAHDILLIRRDR